MGGKTFTKSARIAPRAVTSAGAAKPIRLAGGNPQIAKGDGDGPSQAFIAAMPGPARRGVGRDLDSAGSGAARLGCELRALPQQLELADGGQVLLWPHWLMDSDASALLGALSAHASWQQRQLKIFGKLIDEPRLTIWFGDPGAIYRYSGRSHHPEPWTSGLAKVRNLLVECLDVPLNSALANLYRSERDSLGWHADDERELGPFPTIASLSLGATRRFWLKHPRAETVRLSLAHGSLLVMRGSTQHHWKHCVPKERSPTAPRINVTFRQIRSTAS